MFFFSNSAFSTTYRGDADCINVVDGNCIIGAGDSYMENNDQIRDVLEEDELIFMS